MKARLDGDGDVLLDVPVIEILDGGLVLTWEEWETLVSDVNSLRSEHGKLPIANSAEDCAALSKARNERHEAFVAAHCAGTDILAIARNLLELVQVGNAVRELIRDKLDELEGKLSPP